MRNFFGKRNAETDQEPSSSGCSGSDKSESSKKPAPQKDQKFLSSWLGRHKRLRYKNNLMFNFCDTCLTAKASLKPFKEGPSKKRWDPHFQWWDPRHNQS